jgi:hypothetical protein
VHQFVGDIPDLLSQFGAVEHGNLVTERQAVPFQAAGSCGQWDNGRARPAWRPELEIGTTITDCQVGTTLKALWESTMTGRRPICSDPERGARLAQ